MNRLLCCYKPNHKTNSIHIIQDAFKELQNVINESCDSKNYGHIYMIKEREFVNANLNVYKIGKSTKIVNRMPSYPKNSLIYFIVYVPYDVHKIEKILISECDKNFIQRQDIGREYYECNLQSIMHLLNEFQKQLYNV